jgi:tRNA pseudouridine55 synthase
MHIAPDIRGIVAIWKPKGPTSHDIVDSIRRITRERTVGHAGTLDPLAEGILVVGIGKDATKRLSQEVAKEKEYETVIELGVTSLTDDSEGPFEKRENLPRPTEERVRGVLERFRGTIMQVPPRFSALKLSGKTAYKEAREGRTLALAARPAEVRSIELLEYAWPLLKLRIVTGPGVYIRAIARDLGEELGTGGYMKELVRTRIGDFTREQAFTLDF